MNNLKRIAANMNFSKIYGKSLKNNSPITLKERVAHAAVVVFSIVLLMLGTFYAYNNTKVVNNIFELPLVQRDAAPLRVKPAYPGGLIVSNQNKEVYSYINKGADTNKGLKSDEQKIIRSMVNKFISEKKDIHELNAAVPKKEVNEIKNKKKDTIFDLLLGKKDSKHMNKERGDLKVATLRSYVEAEKEWRRLIAKHPLIRKHRYKITEKVIASGKKVFYLWIRDLGKDEVSSICNNLKINNNNCVIKGS